MMSVTLLPSAPPRQMWCKGVRTMNHWRWLNQSILLLQGDAATHPVGCNIPVRSIDFCRLSGSSLLTFKDQRLITQHMVLETSTNILHNPSNTRNSRHPESAKVKKRLLFFFGFFFCQNSLTRLQMTLTEKPTESKSIVRNIASPAQSECNIKTTLQSEISLFFVVVFFPFFSPHNFLATSKSWHSGLQWTPRIWLRGFTVLQSVKQKQPVWSLEFRMWWNFDDHLWLSSIFQIN